MTEEEKYEHALAACRAARAGITIEDVRAWLFDDVPPPRPSRDVDPVAAADAWHEVLPRAYEMTWVVRTEWGPHRGRTRWQATARYGASVSTAEDDSVDTAMLLAAAPIVRGHE